MFIIGCLFLLTNAMSLPTEDFALGLLLSSVLSILLSHRRPEFGRKVPILLNIQLLTVDKHETPLTG
jgi:hypothetical protein